jgi:ABC-type uncharacterized transport system permease subunit
VPAVLYGRERWRRACLPFTVAAFFFHAVAVVDMLLVSRQGSTLGMHQIEALLGLLIAAAFLVVWRVYRTISFGVFALPLAFVLVFLPALNPTQQTFSSPGVRAGWLYLHIGTLLAAYAALIFSMLASFLYLVQENRLKRKQPSRLAAWLPPLETTDRIAYAMLLIGFPLMTVGLLVGSVIAEASMGNGYFVDPKVILSFVMWIVYIVLLFIRRSTGLRGRRAAYVSSAVFLVMLTVWAANLLSSVHRYAAP